MGMDLEHLLKDVRLPSPAPVVLTLYARLEDGSAVLVRDIRIARDAEESFSTRQVFDRG